MSPLRVAYIINHYPKVSHTFIRREILALQARGVRVLRVSFRGWDETLPDHQDQDEQQLTRYVLKSSPWVLLLTSLKVPFGNPSGFYQAVLSMLTMIRASNKPWYLHCAYLLEACVISQWVKQSRSDHIHAHFGTNPAEVALFTSLLTRIPFSFTVHGYEEFDRPVQLSLKHMITRARFVSAISSFTRSQLFRWSDTDDWAKIYLVRCGVDHQFLTLPVQPPHSVSQLVCVGRLCEEKGQVLLIQALRLLRHQGFVCRVVLAGDGPTRPLIEELIVRHGLQSHVLLTGWVAGNDVQQLILSSRAMVLPSFAEGLPVVLMESLALMRPVISTYIAGIPELVENGRSGWLVPAGSVSALADAIRQCLHAPMSEIERMGRYGQNMVRRFHDVSIEAQKLHRLFEKSDVIDTTYLKQERWSA